MKVVRKVLSSPFFAGALAVLLLAVAVVWVGELVVLGDWRPFGTWVGQAIFIGFWVGVWLLLFGIWLWRRRRRNKKLVEDIAEPEIDPQAEKISDEEKALNAKFAAALKDLAKLRFRSRLGGSRYLYQLPWYVFIGPPGAGKTTALEKCGLDFPLKRGTGEISIDGGSGTANCDWVFTNEAVFIDTAGRYTTQDEQAVDRSAWKRFLNLLTRHRPGEAINGVIVAISIGDLALATPGEIDAHAAAVRARLNEISEAMKARVPVYVMFTKADLLVGFNEYFQTLRKTDREQVWGCTFPLKGGLDHAARTAEDLSRFDEEYDRLLERLGEIQFRHIQDEPDIATRAKIFGFPSQFASLKPVVRRFLSEAFKPDRYSEAMLMRGFYLTSATQIGQPVDRLISAMSREFGLERRVVGMMSAEGGRAYFLEGLLREVVFPEAGLVSGARRGRIASSIGRYAALAACVALPIALGLGWWMVREHTRSEAAQVETAITDYELYLVAIDVSPVEDDDLVAILPPLNRLRDEMLRVEDEATDAPLYGLGMNQMGAIRAQARAAYERALDDLMRPRLLYRLEAMLRQNMHKPEQQYEVLKTYLMLGGRGPLDADYVVDQGGRLIEARYPAATNGDILPDLLDHLNWIVTFEPRDRALDDEAIAEARAAISQVSIPERALRILLSRPEARGLDPWTVTSVGSPVAEDVFVRKSGKILDDPIPGIYTYEGFYKVFNGNADAAAEAALSEKWLVADIDDPEEIDRDEILRIRREVRRLYYQQYGDAWETLLKDLAIAPFADASDAAKTLNFLSGGQSPLRAVMQSIARNTALAETPAAESALLKSVVQIGFHKASSRYNTGTRLLVAGADEVATSEPEGMQVQRRFVDLIDYVGSENSGSELENLIGEIKDLYNVVDDMARSDQSGAVLLSEDRTAKGLRRSARNSAPNALATMIVDMIDNAGDTSDVGYVAGLNEVWQSTIYPQCQRRLRGRYPFGNGTEVAFGDLADVLGPDGLIDKFFAERLRPLVRTDITPWEWKRNIGLSAERLIFFETAAQMRDAFFPPGAPPGRPLMRVGVIAEAIVDEIEGVRFSIGGRGATFQQGRNDGAQMEWPGDGAANGASISIIQDQLALGVSDFGDVELTESGPWGFFRLIDRTKVELKSGGSQARLEIGGAMFKLAFDSQINPISLRRVIRNFECPRRL